MSSYEAKRLTYCTYTPIYNIYPPQAGKPSGMQPPPPPIPGEEVGYSHLRSRPVDHLEFEGL